MRECLRCESTKVNESHNHWQYRCRKCGLNWRENIVYGKPLQYAEKGFKEWTTTPEGCFAVFSWVEL